MLSIFTSFSVNSAKSLTCRQAGASGGKKISILVCIGLVGLTILLPSCRRFFVGPTIEEIWQMGEKDREALDSGYPPGTPRDEVIAQWGEPRQTVFITSERF